MLGQSFNVTDANFGCVLGYKIVYQNLILIFVKVMQSRFFGMEDKIGLERQYVLQESSELINLAADFNIRSRIIMHKLGVVLYLVGEFFLFRQENIKIALLFKYAEVAAFLLTHLALFLDLVLNLFYETLYLTERIFC